jgi:hypothetical protein
MPKRFTLVALWALFAAAAVGVGFGASGLVGQPFTADPSSDVGTTLGSPSPSQCSSPATSSASATSARNYTTRGGFVSATCTGRLVEVTATPATGWELDDRTTGRVRSAKVKFEPVGDSHGAKVTVYARCDNGTPTFDLRARAANSDNSGSGSADDNGGGGGGGNSGGGDDSGGGGHGGDDSGGDDSGGDD